MYLIIIPIVVLLLLLLYFSYNKGENYDELIKNDFNEARKKIDNDLAAFDIYQKQANATR